MNRVLGHLHIPILCSHGAERSIFLHLSNACRMSLPTTIGLYGRTSHIPRSHSVHGLQAFSATARSRHAAPSPLLSYPLESVRSGPVALAVTDLVQCFFHVSRICPGSATSAAMTGGGTVGVEDGSTGYSTCFCARIEEPNWDGNTNSSGSSSASAWNSRRR